MLFNMDLTLKNQGSVYKLLLFLFPVLLAFWILRSLSGGLSTQVSFSVTALETVEQIIEQIKEENTDVSSKGGGKRKPSLKKEIENAKGRLSKSEYKAARSNYNRMVEHIDKLEKYRHNPLKYDNLGLLKNAPNELVKQKIIQARIAHLEKEIQTYYNNIVKIIN